MDLIIAIVLFVVIAGLIMIGTNILYDVAIVVVPLLAIFMIAVGILVGLVVAIKNTFTVYKSVYFQKNAKNGKGRR